MVGLAYFDFRVSSAGLHVHKAIKTAKVMMNREISIYHIYLAFLEFGDLSDVIICESLMDTS